MIIWMLFSALKGVYVVRVTLYTMYQVNVNHDVTDGLFHSLANKLSAKHGRMGKILTMRNGM